MAGLPAGGASSSSVQFPKLLHEPAEEDAEDSDGPPPLEECDEAYPPSVEDVAAVLRQRDTMQSNARHLEAAIESTRLLAAAVDSGDAEAIETACRVAQTLGVPASTVEVARGRLRVIRQARLLEAALHGGQPEMLERECEAAAAVGVDALLVVAARERARQLRETRLLATAIGSRDVEAIEHACEEARAAGCGSEAVETARRRCRQLREEHMLAAAVRGDSAQMQEACDAAEAAGVEEATIDMARRQRRTLESFREAISGAEAAGHVEDGSAAGAVRLVIQDQGGERPPQAVALNSSAFRLLAAVRAAFDATEAASRSVALAAFVAHLGERRQGLDDEALQQALEAARRRARDIAEAESRHCLGSGLGHCTICLEALDLLQAPKSEDSELCVLPCYHAFHCSCVSGWLRAQGSCPNCRQSLGESSREAPATEDAEAAQQRPPELSSGLRDASS
eukprot:TRINITY_DN65024_c0_g1_i1.p1 TRINITY_DN65024_c0_g1~~TRINITY_DN65024_c0_g1_i1.p1  ORF type:complete len:454 (+),score=111.11 TRINITY_DN65024_c0_g1_i1:115-1476(+)